MKKKQRIKKEGNVLLFPDIEKRLFEKGLDYIQKKKYRDAIPLLEEAHLHDSENGEIQFALVLAYYESGRWMNAREVAEQMLQTGVGDYFQIVDLLIMILVELQDYEQIQRTIEVLLDEQEIPQDKIEHFKRMYDFSERMAKQSSSGKLVYDEEVTEPLVVSELSIDDAPDLLIQKIALLANQNIYPLLDQIKAYLLSPAGHPFLKTMLLNLLKEHGVDKPFVVTKLGREQEVVPVTLTDARESEQEQKIKESAATVLLQRDPTLYSHLNELLGRHMLFLYPFELQPNNPKVLAASYHWLVQQYLGQDECMEDICLEYAVDEDLVSEAIFVIQQLEEISSPIF